MTQTESELLALVYALANGTIVMAFLGIFAGSMYAWYRIIKWAIRRQRS